MAVLVALVRYSSMDSLLFSEVRVSLSALKPVVKQKLHRQLSVEAMREQADMLSILDDHDDTVSPRLLPTKGNPNFV